ncbi:3-deoxy-8-phosphooctulonate synthase [Robertmurraya massiliosenegalensis]|uniref:3-deoxy-8-phosphooctulonate synthase n=1 Tax=Robertmurraya massiliosenegalensis TaxID=1287657 RepID=UPI0002E0A7E2|nr:3-deoxy-8-phosphooctulonate synthase [Robertmurraya massiliosenegalensis]
MNKLAIGDFETGDNLPFFLIAGPCVIESEKLVMDIAGQLKEITNKLGIKLVFKSSFDKANRSSVSSFRGLGINEGLRILNKVKREFEVPVLTDIHLHEHADEVGQVVDILQIPAFLCRQTDLLEAAAKTGKVINVKKGQFLSPNEMVNVVDKFEKFGNNNVMLCERGTTFGYNNLIVDMSGIVEMKKFGKPVIFDGTHSVQKPGGNGTSTGGNRENVAHLSRAAVAVGIDGLFLETHPDPDNALSDGPNMVKTTEIEELLKVLQEIDFIVKKV